MSDIAQRITDSIIKQLESGVAPWVKPWKDNGQPTNAKTGEIYQGINYFWLSMLQGGEAGTSNYWLTYNQAKDMGAQVKKGAKGVQVIFYKQLAIGDKSEGQEGEGNQKVIPMLKTYTVFNADFVEGLPAKIAEPLSCEPFVAIEKAQAFIDCMSATIKEGGGRAYYATEQDFIALPTKETFKTNQDFYATALHELGHWTGNKNRLDRDFSKSKKFGDSAYALEELVAELTCAMSCAYLGLDGQLQHAEYIGSWLKVLKSDPKAILTAGAQAQKAFNFLQALEAQAIAPAEQKAA